MKPASVSGFVWFKGENRGVAANNGSYCPNRTLYPHPSKCLLILPPEIRCLCSGFLQCLGVKLTVVSGIDALTTDFNTELAWLVTVSFLNLQVSEILVPGDRLCAQ